jgi:alkanesulfonate monooxygenase SsuD/methylene tetrahydromethanopterin reductase-like flavin-dependent oxidoreductase (luciferase family)
MRVADLYESRLTLAERADQAGFWGYHKSEHHLISLDNAPSPSVFLAAVSQRTSRIRICSLVHLLPFYHPLRLYEEVCMLDHLSRGRFELGFGKGISAPEHQLWGLDPDEAVARTDEALQLLLAAFACDDDHFSFDGDYNHFADIPMEMRPFQRPHPPLWRPGQIETAAALGVSTVAAGPIPMVNQSIELYRSLLPAGTGGPEPTIGAFRKFIVAPTDAEADQLGRRTWPRYTFNLRSLFDLYGIEPPSDPSVGGDYEKAKEVQAVVVGSPATVRGHVEELAEAGLVEYVIGGFAFGDMTHDEALRSLELFAEHVVAPLAG